MSCSRSYCNQFELYEIILLKIRDSLEEINGGFTHDGYDCKFSFIPDQRHAKSNL